MCTYTHVYVYIYNYIYIHLSICSFANPFPNYKSFPWPHRSNAKPMAGRLIHPFSYWETILHLANWGSSCKKISSKTIVFETSSDWS